MTDPKSKALLPLENLIGRGRLTLLLNQEGLADLVESSKRTVQRWETGRAQPAPWHLHKLADALRSKDPEMAAQIDRWAPRPAAPPAPDPRTPLGVPLPDHVLVESVLCAAAEAMTVAPQAARPAVLAAFRRALEARLAPETVVAVLAPPKAETESKTAEATKVPASRARRR